MVEKKAGIPAATQSLTCGGTWLEDEDTMECIPEDYKVRSRATLHLALPDDTVLFVDGPWDWRGMLTLYVKPTDTIEVRGWE